MKKILLSSIAGLAVISSACAAPSVEDRKALCEKYPDRYVWVERDEFCAPINPCESNDETVRRAYCSSFKLHNFGKNRDLVINRYVEKELNVKVLNIKEVGNCTFGVKILDKFGYEGYFGITCYRDFTQEGYFSEWGDGPALTEVPDEFLVAFSIADAAEIYQGEKIFFYTDMIETRSWRGSMSACNDVADFASLLSGTLITYSEVDGGQCELKW